MKQVSRLATISPTLFESLERVSEVQRRQVAISMCAKAIDYTGLRDENVERALELLRCGDAINSKAKGELDKLRDKFDQQYLNLDGSPQRYTSEALQMFRKARAVSALLYATSTEGDDVYDAVYEAIHAMEDQTEAIHTAENSLLLKGTDIM